MTLSRLKQIPGTLDTRLKYTSDVKLANHSCTSDVHYLARKQCIVGFYEHIRALCRQLEFLQQTNLHETHLLVQATDSNCCYKVAIK